MSDAEPPPRTWPQGRVLDENDSTLVRCASCALPWRVHHSLAGFRLRCDCGQWIAVAALPVATLPAPAEPLALPDRVRPVRHADGMVTLPGDPGETVFSQISTDLPMAPGSMLRASESARTRWTNRTVFELAALLTALIGPQLLAHLLAGGRESELLLPFASLVSGVLVLVIAANTGPYGLLGLRRASFGHFAEALLAAGIGLLFAIGWLHVLHAAFDGIDADPLGALRERLGLLATLFVVAVAPAVLEEVTFRGVLQGRVQALFGSTTGLIVAAAAFALCHGQPVVLPIHFGLGLYLGWLRLRSGSLLPGMLTHFAYNAAVVLTGI